MKILQVIGPGSEFEILEKPVPIPAQGEALIKIDGVTTCPQWDLHLRHNEPMFIGHHFHYPYTPGQPGHEATGIVEEVGEGVHSFHPGDRVSVWRDAGHQIYGCYAQYVVRPITDIIRIPADLTPEAAAPLELAMCVGAVFLMLREMNGLHGKRVGISGLGPAGLIAMQMAKAEGASEVFGFDTEEVRRNYAVNHGLFQAYDPLNTPESLPPARPSECGLDTSVDCVGARASVEFMMDHSRNIVALFGVQREEYHFAPKHYMHLKLCGYSGHSYEAAKYALQLIEAGKLDLSILVTHHLPLEKYKEGIALLESKEAIKVCFNPWP